MKKVRTEKSKKSNQKIQKFKKKKKKHTIVSVLEKSDYKRKL